MNTPSRLSNLSMQSMNSTASHNVERIQALGDKLSQIHLTLRNEKLSKLEKLDFNLKNCGEKVIDFSEVCTEKFNQLKEQLNKLFSKIETQNNHIQNGYEQKMQYLQALETKVVERFEQEAKLRKEMERKAILLIEERSNYLLNELNKEAKNRQESLDNFHRIIECDIPKLQESLKEENSEMNENDSAVQNKIFEESQKLMHIVNNERKAREETEDALLEMLKAMINAMKTQLENEKRER
jgi:hypothetical protein